MSNINKEYGKIEPSELHNFKNDYVTRGAHGSHWLLSTKNYFSFSEYLNSKNKAYIIHKFYSNPINIHTDGNGNKSYHTPKYIIDNYGNIYNIGDTDSSDYSLKFLKKIDPYNQMHPCDQMHPYAIYENKLSNKSIKLIKDLEYCSEDNMQKSIKNLLEDKEEDIHFMKNKIK